MILATGGEFLNVEWRDDDTGRSFVAFDMNGEERVRITWTGWPHASRPQRLAILWDLCAVTLYPDLRRIESSRQFDDVLATMAPEATS